MNKSLSLSLTFLVALTGCSAFKNSQTWRQVVDHRSDKLASNTGKSGYPEKLHEVLAAQNVEHKIVTYQYRYRTGLREEAVGTGRVVFYRDTTTPDSPWWAMDEHSGFPVWVPNESLDRQVSFFVRRDAEILAQQDFPGTSGGKSFDAAPQMAASRVPTAAPSMFAQARKPAVNSRTKAMPAAPAAIAATAVASDSPGTRSAWLDSLDRRFDEKFRSTHGTTFDPRSSTDRQKMVELRQAMAAHNVEI